MGLTHFPFGVSSFGIPVIGSGLELLTVRGVTPNQEIFFVDGTNGNDGNTGKSPEAAKKTIQVAIDLTSHDVGATVIVGEGNYAEQIHITTRGLKLIGVGPYRTNIAPATTMTAGDLVTPVITVSPVAVQPTTTQGVTICNLRVSGAGGYTGIYIGDTYPVGSHAGNASATIVSNCIIDGSNREGLYGIVIRGGSFIRIGNSLIASWTRAGVVVASGATRTAYYNVVRDNDIISGGTCGIAFQYTANSNISRNNAFVDDATTPFTSCIQVAALAGFGASTGTDNASIGDYFASAGTNGALLGASDHISGSFARNAGNDSSAYPPQTATFGSL